MHAKHSGGLTKFEVQKIVGKFIGVEGGYLIGFSYQKLTDFYPDFCELEIDPFAAGREGTTRARFTDILFEAEPWQQAQIIRGILCKCEVGEELAPATRTPDLATELVALTARLEGIAVASHAPVFTSEVVRRAITDAEQLIATTGATSAVDRVHTALHGHLIWLARASGIEVDRDTPLAGLLKRLRAGHPKLAPVGPRAQDISKVLNAFGAVLDAFSPVRNNAAVAHPNEALLDREEALLVVNSARTILSYLDSKLGAD
jgi:Abortive infection C-terminus